MISILLPTYNYDCCALVTELSSQMATCGVAGEIVVVDDCSSDVRIRESLQRINDIPYARLVELPKKISIASIRNRLFDEARHDVMICLDSDTFPRGKDFIKRYLDAIEHVDVVCGGLAYRETEDIGVLRMKYGNHYEVRTAEERNEKPYESFKTSNYCLRRKVAERVRFDEAFVCYGNEDTLFGRHVETEGFSIKHIDNPVYHDDRDADLDFLRKTYMGIDNLVLHSDKLLSHSKLLRLYMKLKRFGVAFIFRLAFVLFGGMMERQVLSGHPSMKVFQVLKLCYLSFQMVHIPKTDYTLEHK